MEIMISRSIATILAFAAGTVVSFAQPAINGRVAGVHDGNSITVVDSRNAQHKVRLLGTDAPDRNQDFGRQAMQYLADQVMDKEVTVVGDRRDEFGLRLGKVLLGGRDINLEMVIAGLAWHRKQNADQQTADDRKLYSSAEINAKRAKLNIWSDPDPTPPWVFRAEAAVKAAVAGRIMGNANSKIFHKPGCPGYTRVAPGNRVFFETEAEAEAAGYRKARNCSK
jgi:endonuclease YncB( thermonuclease family)